MTKSTSPRFCRCVLFCVLMAFVLCAAWCAAASTDDNVPTAAALSTSADSSSGDERCASASDCYTVDQGANIGRIIIAIKASLQNTGWPEQINFCAFQHITCWTSGVVVNFTGVGLVGSLPSATDLVPDAIAKTPITAMIFDNNSGITGTLTSDFGYMTQMKTFSATKTGLSGTLPETWSAMTGLQVLRLSNTPVTGTLPASWSSLIHLTTVALDNTSLSGTLPAEWSTMTSLTSFTAAGTEVDGTLPEMWSAMAALQVFSVNGTQVDGTLPASWSSLKAMRSISIANTTVSGTLPPEWGNLTSLVTFDAAETELNGTLPTSWSTMTALQVLRLTGAPVNGTIPESWSAMRSLKTVSLAGTNITGCLPASWTDVLGLTMTGVGLPESAACNKASKHKSKMPWWAILILVLGLVFVAAASTLAILWWKSKLPCKLLNRRKQYRRPGYIVWNMRINTRSNPYFFGNEQLTGEDLVEGPITRSMVIRFRRRPMRGGGRRAAPPAASAAPDRAAGNNNSAAASRERRSRRPPMVKRTARDMMRDARRGRLTPEVRIGKRARVAYRGKKAETLRKYLLEGNGFNPPRPDNLPSYEEIANGANPMGCPAASASPAAERKPSRTPGDANLPQAEREYLQKRLEGMRRLRKREIQAIRDAKAMESHLQHGNDLEEALLNLRRCVFTQEGETSRYFGNFIKKDDDEISDFSSDVSNESSHTEYLRTTVVFSTVSFEEDRDSDDFSSDASDDDSVLHDDSDGEARAFVDDERPHTRPSNNRKGKRATPAAVHPVGRMPQKPPVDSSDESSDESSVEVPAVPPRRVAPSTPLERIPKTDFRAVLLAPFEPRPPKPKAPKTNYVDFDEIRADPHWPKPGVDYGTLDTAPALNAQGKPYFPVGNYPTSTVVAPPGELLVWPPPPAQASPAPTENPHHTPEAREDSLHQTNPTQPLTEHPLFTSEAQVESSRPAATAQPPTERPRPAPEAEVDAFQPMAPARPRVGHQRPTPGWIAQSRPAQATAPSQASSEASVSPHDSELQEAEAIE